MTISRNPGRVAGLWYLLLIFLGPLRLIYIPNKLFVAGNAAATIGNIAAHDILFRAGIASDLLGALVLVLLTLAFYRLFAEVDQRLSVLVVILGGVMPALLYFVGAAGDLGVLLVIHDTGFLSVLDKPQQDALAMLLLRLRDAEITVSELLWGAWLLPLAALVYRSRFLPRILGVWLALGGFSYICLSFTGVLWPQYRHQVFAVSQPAFFSEVGLTLWLVFRGSRMPGRS